MNVKQVQDKIDSIYRKLPESYRQRLRTLFANPKNIQTLGLWTSALVAGFIAVGYAKVFRLIEEAVHRTVISSHSDWIFLISPLFFLAAWYVVRRYSPEAAGSGIPQVMAANEIEYRDQGRLKVDRLLSLRTAVVKVISSLLCLLGGGAIGREGPTLQISTSVFHFFGRAVRRFAPETSEQTWVVAGAAAGLASAFNTPLGGIVYAIEELGVPHFHRLRTALISAVIVSGLVAQWILGSYLYLGYPALQAIKFSFLPVALFNGVVTGLAGGVFGHFLFYLLQVRQKLPVKGMVVATLACGVLMAALIKIEPRSAGTGVGVITQFLFDHHDSGAVLVSGRFFGTMLSYLSGAAGGIFSPSLAIGATIGAWMTEIFHTQHPNLMVLLGMIGFLTGVTRTPFTSFILVLEMTDRHVAIFPMMLVALVSLWAARLTDAHSFYEHVKDQWLGKPVSI